MKALAVIRNEHRTLAAVVHGLVHHVRELGAGRTTPDFELLAAMLWYIDAFPEKLHHPKEDAYLFPRVRARCPEAHAVIDTLEGEHATGAVKIRELERSLVRFQSNGKRVSPEFALEVESFATFQWDHMRREERVLIPYAQATLTPEDWSALDAAFASNTDPLHGEADTATFDGLYARIVSLAPPR